MTVSQRDARSVRVEHGGLAFSLAYRFWWEGRDRSPESIAVEDGRVTAFFLSAAVRDTIRADAHGVLVHRVWSVRGAGPVRLAIDVLLDPGGTAACLLPGVALERGLPAAGVAAHGARTAWPAAAAVTIDGRGTVGFALDEGPTPGGVAIAPVDQEDVPPSEREEGPLPIVLSLTLPGPDVLADAPGARAGEVPSPGNVEATATFRIVGAPARRAWLRGAAAVIAALDRGAPRSLATRAVRASVTGALERCLATHLVEKGRVTGLRVEPASSVLSASAGVGMAVLLAELFPDDPARAELALRLADFSLTAQHPGGHFYEAWDSGAGRWVGVPGHPERAAIGIAAAARIADRLLALAESLDARGLPNAKYRIAGERFVESFFDDRGRFHPAGAVHAPGSREPLEPGLGGLALCFPLARVLARSGHDRHRKALAELAHAFGSLPWGTPWLPSSRDGRDPDAAGALFCARVLLTLARFAGAGRGGTAPRGTASRAGSASRRGGARGTPRLPVDVGDVAAVVLPWVYANRRPSQAGVVTLGGVVDSFHRQRLLGAGAEAGWVLAGLAGYAAEPWLRRTLEGYSRLCLDFADAVPPGTSFVPHLAAFAAARAGDETTRPRGQRGSAAPAAGPVDARRLVVEAGCRLAAASGPGKHPLLV